MPRLKGKFVSQAVYDEYIAQQDKAAMTDITKENSTMELRNDVNIGDELESDKPHVMPDYLRLVHDIATAEQVELNETDETELSEDAMELVDYLTSDEYTEDQAKLQELDEEYELSEEPVWKTETITIGELRKRAQAGLLNVELAYQRKPFAGAWGKTVPTGNNPLASDRLHDSILRGWFIMPFIYQDTATDRFDVQDSLQRQFTIMDLITNNHVPSTFDRCHDGRFKLLNGRPFSFWPEVYQQRYLNMPILVIHNDKDTPIPDTNEMFVRWNKGGVPLSKTQARRGQYADKLESLEDAIKHKVWRIKYTNTKGEEQAIHGKLGQSGIEDIIIRMANTLYAETINHDGDIVSEWFRRWTMPTHVITEIINKVKTYNRLLELVLSQENGVKIARRIAGKSSAIIPLLPILDEHMTDDNFLGIYGLFNADKGSKVASEWSALAKAGTTDAANIKKREEILRHALSGR